MEKEEDGVEVIHGNTAQAIRGTSTFAAKRAEILIKFS